MMDYLQYPRWKGERATLAMAGKWVSFRLADDTARSRVTFQMPVPESGRYFVYVPIRSMSGHNDFGKGLVQWEITQRQESGDIWTWRSLFLCSPPGPSTLRVWKNWEKRFVRRHASKEPH